MSSDGHDDAAPASLLSGLLQRTGTAAIALMGGLVPLAFLPPSWATLPVDAARPLLLVKDWMLRGSASMALACAALLLALGHGRALREARLPALLIAAYLLTTAVACVASDDAGFALRAAMSEVTVWLVVLAAPVLLTNARRVRVVLYASVAGATAVGAIAAASAWGRWGGALKFIYGRDFVAEILAGDQQLVYTTQGGLRRVASQATLGNPEYAGMYLAVGLLLLGMWLMSGWGSRVFRFWPAWLLGLGAAGTVGAAVLATGTRGAWVVVAAGGVACWLGALPLRGLWIAMGLAGVLVVGLATGPATTVLVSMAMVAAVLAWQLTSNHVLAAWHALVPRVRVALLAGPVVLVALAVAQTFPNPLNRNLIGRVSDKLASFSTADDSVRERTMWLLLASDMCLRHPLTGVGPGFYPVNLHPTLARLVEADDTGTMAVMQKALKTFLAMDVHNDWFQVAAEQGLPGLVVFVGVWVALLAGLRRATHGGGTRGSPLAHALLVALAGYATMMLTSFPMQEPSRLAAMGGLLAAAMATLALNPPPPAASDTDSPSLP